MGAKYASMALAVNGGGLMDIAVLKKLEGRSFDGVVVVQSAAEALSRLRLLPESASATTATALKAPPSLLLISMRTSDFDPFEVCRVVKESFQDVFVIMVADKECPWELGASLPGSLADDFLMSPFSFDELESRIDLLLGRHFRSLSKPAAIAPPPSHSLRMPQPGEALGRFLILEIVKAGDSVAVCKAVDRTSNALYAVKALFGKGALDPQTIADFEREGEIMATIKHPNVMGCRERGSSSGVRYIVMEWVDGTDLEDYLLIRGAPPLESFFKVARDVAAGMRALHLQGLVHRDLKLSNILLRAGSCEALVADLGIAASFAATASGALSFIQGSLQCMPPEIAAGGAPTQVSDIYSYGAAMYQFLTGSPPFAPTSPDGEKSSVPRPARLLRPDVPEGLDCFLSERCLAANPASRPQSADEVISSLEAIASGLSGSGPKSGSRVLFVDDERTVLDSLQSLLRREPYQILVAGSGEEALSIVSSQKVQLFITDYRMPAMNGVELARRVREISPDTVRIVFSGQADTEAVVSAVNEGNVYKFLIKSWYRDDLKQNIRLALDHYALQERNRELDALLASRNRELSEVNAELESRVAARSAEVLDAKARMEAQCSGLVEAVFKIIEFTSADTASHCRRVGLIAKALAEASGASVDLVSDIETAGYLHDIGKLALFSEMKGRLSKDEEARLMARHPAIGAKILESIPGYARIAEAVRSHHESYDGQGYPARLAGDAICLGGRVVALADAFDRFVKAESSTIIRKLPFAEEALCKLAGQRLDPALVKLFVGDLSRDLYARLFSSPPRASA